MDHPTRHVLLMGCLLAVGGALTVPRLASACSGLPVGSLVQQRGRPAVYMVADDQRIRHIPNEALARAWYGPRWNTQVSELSEPLFTRLTIGDPMTPSDVIHRPLRASAQRETTQQRTTPSFDEHAASESVIFPKTLQPVMERARRDGDPVLYGYVRDGKTLQPIPSASVTLLAPQRGGASFHLFADGAGRYELHPWREAGIIRSGSYTVTASVSIDDERYDAFRSDVRDGFRIDASNVQRFDFILKNETAETPMLHAPYFGRIVTRDGKQPLARATVTLYPKGSPGTFRVSTNASGFYQFAPYELPHELWDPERVDFLYVLWMPDKGPVLGPLFVRPEDMTRRRYDIEL